MNLVERVAKRAAQDQAPAGMSGADLHNVWKKAEPHFRQVLHQHSKTEWHLKEIKGPTEHGETTIVWESPGQGSVALYGTSSGPKTHDVRLYYNDASGMPEQPKMMRVPSDKMGSPAIVEKLIGQLKGKTEWTKKPKTAYLVAARHLAALVADQSKAAPKKVDDLFKEVKDGNPSYSDEQAWATAWSIYCKHVDPNGEHCHTGPGGYLKEADVAEEGSIERPTPSATKNQLAGEKGSMMSHPTNHLNQFPNGKWGFVGSADVRLIYLTPQGHELDLKKDEKFINDMRHVGPGIMKAKSRVYQTPFAAMEAAKALGQGITVAKHDMAKHPEIEEGLKKSGVKHKIQ